MDRRKFITASSTALATILAGCTSSGSDPEDREQGSTDGGSGDDGDRDSGSAGGDGGSESEQFVDLLEHEWYNDGQYDAGVRGKIKNVSEETLSYVQIDVFFLDSEGTQIGEGVDNTSDLAPGRVLEFEVAYLDTDADRVEDYEIDTSVTNY